MKFGLMYSFIVPPGSSMTHLDTFREMDSLIPYAEALGFESFQTTEQHFQNNGRAARITLRNNDSPIFSFDARDQVGGQLFALPSNLKLQSFSVHIDHSFRGVRYPEVALSEFFFMDGPQSIVLKTDWSERIQKETADEIQQTPLRLYLNRPIINRIQHSSGTFYYHKKLYISKNGHFYAQVEKNERNKNRTIQHQISGHWELQDYDENRARLRFFGRSEQTDFSSNTTPTFQEDLFNEVIDIQLNRINGGELLGTFYLR